MGRLGYGIVCESLRDTDEPLGNHVVPVLEPMDTAENVANVFAHRLNSSADFRGDTINGAVPSKALGDVLEYERVLGYALLRRSTGESRVETTRESLPELSAVRTS